MGHEQEKTRLCWWWWRYSSGWSYLLMLAGICSQIRQQFSEETQIFYSIIKALFLVFFYFVVRSFLFLPIPFYFYVIDYKSKICLFFVCVATTADVRTIANQYQDWNGRMQDWQQGRILFSWKLFSSKFCCQEIVYLFMWWGPTNERKNIQTCWIWKRS